MALKSPYQLRSLLLAVGAYGCSSLLLSSAIAEPVEQSHIIKTFPVLASALDQVSQANPRTTVPAPALENILRPTPSPTPTVQPVLPQPSAPGNLLNPPKTPPPPREFPTTFSGEIKVKEFVFDGSTAFSQTELNKVLDQFTKEPITFTKLLEAGAAVTKLYFDQGYVTTVAIVPPQRIREGVVKIRVIEGKLEAIRVKITGGRLKPSYVRSRLAIAASKPLNVNRLLEALQLLRLNPLIKSISAQLSGGLGLDQSILDVTVTEAKTFNAQLSIDNNRSPSVGTFQRQVRLAEADLLGLGDGLSVGYSNTDGSNGGDISYTLPINPRNGTLNFYFSAISSSIVERPFNVLDINADFRDYELTLRQPVVQSPTQEFALGLTAARRETKATFIQELRAPFPSPGADERGRTQLSELRFFQEYTRRSSQQVVALRSQFNFGLGILGATTNPTPPDGRFFLWQGQAQLLRSLGNDKTLLLRADVQLADRPLAPIEQFGLGGEQNIRGYRQDVVLGDSGALGSAEVRLPIIRDRNRRPVLQLTPFIDVGTVFNSSDTPNPSPSTLASGGLGLLLQFDRLSARLDYGIPFVDVGFKGRTWQENGVYFYVVYNPF